MKSTAGYSLVLLACFTAAQTSAEFHSRYGEPGVERFRIRDGIGLTVLYGQDGRACQMEVKAQQLIVQRPDKKLMSAALIEEIVNEIAPAETRGRKVNHLIQQFSRARDDVDFYENVTISVLSDEGSPLKPERFDSARVVFSRKECPNPGLPQ